MTQPDPPSGLEYVPTTDVFDNTSVAPGLLRAHRVADGVWARLVVYSGAITFVFADQPEHPSTVHTGGTITITPVRWHHLELDEPATFSLDFCRAPSTPRPVPGTESTALHPESG
jgi:tellurite resistance-related uncharacterized protein